MTDKLANGERVPLTPEEQAAYDARQLEPDPDQERREDYAGFLAKLSGEIAWLESEIATAPAQGTTTSGNAVARLDALLQHVKRLDRGLVRLAKNVQGIFDAEA